MDTVTSTTLVHALRIFDGKWKVAIINRLFQQSPLRFSELKRQLPGITQKMLTAQLRSLEENNIVHRVVYPVVPPRVEYSLTERGRALCPVFDAIHIWEAAQH